MRIHSVSIDGELDLFGGRALIINTDKGVLKTPNRSLTSSEFNYKSKMPFRPPLDNSVSEIVAQFDKDNWENFMNKNGPFNNRLRTLESYADKMRYSVKHYYPQISPKVNLDLNCIKQLIMLQSMTDGLDFISIPSLPPGSHDFNRIAEECTTYILSERKEPLIYLDMNLDPDIFERRFLKLLELSESDQIRCVGLVHRTIRSYSKNYHFLWKNRDSKVLLQMSQIPREIMQTSTMHLLQKYGIDSFSVEVSRPHVAKGEEFKPKPSSQIKRFDPDPLLFRQFRTWSDHDLELRCNCPVCRNKSATEFVDTYKSEYETYQGETFGAANKLHECYRSLDEFESSRKYIRSGELKEYFTMKEGLRASDSQVPPREMSIFDFK